MLAPSLYPMIQPDGVESTRQIFEPPPMAMLPIALPEYAMLLSPITAPVPGGNEPGAGSCAKAKAAVWLAEEPEPGTTEPGTTKAGAVRFGRKLTAGIKLWLAVILILRF
jgi:hypothetical protein